MDSRLTIVDITGSTNDDLLEAGKQGATHGTGLAARAQTAGRGRRGHKWDSTAGNLLLSIVLRPCVNPAKYSGLAAVSGLAVLEALEKQGLANEIGLKWPNDLVARGRKLGGILVEAARDNEGKPFAVCGIGVNVNYVPQEVPGAGMPYFSTDTVSIQRSLEIHCDEVLMGKNGVDGVYTADPRKDENAKRFETLSYNRALVDNLAVMDASALSMARDNKKRIRVFGLEEPGNVTRALVGDEIGTLVSTAESRVAE